MQPFEPNAAHPHGRSALVSGQEIDGCAGADGGLGRQLTLMLMHPEFLPRSAETDDHEVWLNVPHRRKYFGILGRVFIEAHWWGVHADHFYVRPTGFDSLAGLGGDARRRAEQEDSQVFLAGGRTEPSCVVARTFKQ